MRRRDSLSALFVIGAASVPMAGYGQAPAGKVWRLGLLSSLVPKAAYTNFFRALAEVGYVEGRNLAVDFQFAQGRPELLAELAQALVKASPDLLVGQLNPEVEALKQATARIPIVMMYVTEPVRTGLIRSLAHPGGNITGTTTNAAALAGKMTEILRDAVPRVSTIAWLANPDYPGMNYYWESCLQAAATMRLRTYRLEVRTAADLGAALASLEHARPDALGVSMTGPIIENSRRIIDLALRLKVPALYSTGGPVQNGGLMSYAADFSEIRRRAVSIIDKIFKGAIPADIPVEEPSKFLLTINLKTAAAIGLTIPQSLLLRADEVIQ